jgi:riboflavin-specific deaminase-like protein
MRQLLPEARDDIDPAELYVDGQRGPIGARPWLLVNMIASLDGGTAVQGRSGSLGGPADKSVFVAIRAVADVILVAAGTVRAERYHAPSLPERLREARGRRGQAEVPRLAIVSRRLELDDSLPLFDPEAAKPIVVTTQDAPDSRRQALGDRAEIVSCGEGTVDLVEALTILRSRYGAKVVLTEGGPSLNGALTDAGLVDEHCVTIAPRVVGGDSRRLLHGSHPLLESFTIAHVLEQDGFLFLRYVREISA